MIGKSSRIEGSPEVKDKYADRATRRLDAELNERLLATLSDSTKFELETSVHLDTLAVPDDVEELLDVSAEDETTEYSDEAIDAPVEEYAPGKPSDYKGSSEAPDEEPPVVLASVVFKDREAFEFSAVPQDGEMGFVYLGKNGGRWLAATGELISPLRLYCSIAPPDAPVPWLLAALDRQRDRAALIGTRRLCDRIAEPIEALDQQLRLRVPALSGGWWTPDDLGIGFFCGINGKQEWENHVTDKMSGWNDPFLFDLFKSESDITLELTHDSHYLFSWIKRKTSNAAVAACGSGVRIKHKYRKLTFTGWKWKTKSNKCVGPANLTGSLWLGLIPRARQISYKREACETDEIEVGGFRALSVFSQHLQSDIFQP
jgi:hypothetical protein